MKRTFYQSFLKSPVWFPLFLVVVGSFVEFPPFINLSIYTQLLLLVISSTVLTVVFDERLSQKFVLKFSSSFTLFVFLRMLIIFIATLTKGNPFFWVPICLNFGAFLIFIITKVLTTFIISYLILTVINYLICMSFSKLKDSSIDKYIAIVVKYTLVFLVLSLLIY